MSVFIKINEESAITSDAYCWRLSKKQNIKEDGEMVEKWFPVKFYSSIEKLVQGHIEASLRECDATTFTELLVEQEKTLEALRTALSPLNYSIQRV